MDGPCSQLRFEWREIALVLSSEPKFLADSFLVPSKTDFISQLKNRKVNRSIVIQLGAYVYQFKVAFSFFRD